MVECLPSKQAVAGSSPVPRSKRIAVRKIELFRTWVLPLQPHKAV